MCSVKVDITEQKDTQKPAKTKAKKDGEPNIEENSATSSVEIVDEIFNLSGQPVTRAQESEDLEDTTKTDCPKTPLELGFVPPYTGSETPDASGEDPRKSESGEVPEPDVESGVESNTSEEDTADREMSPRQEGPKL